MSKQVMVIVHADGRMEVDGQGFAGTACEQDALLREIQALLEPKSAREQRKPEYYRLQGAQQRQGR